MSGTVRCVGLAAETLCDLMFADRVSGGLALANACFHMGVREFPPRTAARWSRCAECVVCARHVGQVALLSLLHEFPAVRDVVLRDAAEQVASLRDAAQRLRLHRRCVRGGRRAPALVRDGRVAASAVLTCPRRAQSLTESLCAHAVGRACGGRAHAGLGCAGTRSTAVKAPLSPLRVVEVGPAGAFVLRTQRYARRVPVVVDGGPRGRLAAWVDVVLGDCRRQPRTRVIVGYERLASLHARLVTVPDSTVARVWNTAMLVPLLYISVFVPLMAGCVVR